MNTVDSFSPIQLNSTKTITLCYYSNSYPTMIVWVRHFKIIINLLLVQLHYCSSKWNCHCWLLRTNLNFYDFIPNRQYIQCLSSRWSARKRPSNFTPHIQYVLQSNQIDSVVSSYTYYFQTSDIITNWLPQCDWNGTYVTACDSTTKAYSLVLDAFQLPKSTPSILFPTNVNYGSAFFVLSTCRVGVSWIDKTRNAVYMSSWSIFLTVLIGAGGLFSFAKQFLTIT